MPQDVGRVDAGGSPNMVSKIKKTAVKPSPQEITRILGKELPGLPVSARLLEAIQASLKK